MKKLLAIDNASRLIGWSFWIDGVLQEYGVINLSAHGKIADERIGAYYDEAHYLVKLFKPDLVAIESPGGLGWSVRILSEYLGVFKCVLRRLKVPWVLIAPTQAKKALTGNGRADKRQIQDKAIEMFPATVRSTVTEDEADAIAIGYAAL